MENKDMNVYKKLSFIAILFMGAYIHAHENQETHQEEFSNHEYTEAEIKLLSFLETLHADGNYQDNIRQVIHQAQQTVKAVEIFARVKNDIKNPRFKPSIGFVDKYLSKKKQCHLDILKFLAKERTVRGINETDIINFAPRFAECSDVLFNQKDENFATYNINRLLHLQEIKHERRDCLMKSQPAQAKNNVGNWIRNSEAFQQKIDEEVLIQKEKKEELQCMYENYPHIFDTPSTKNSPLHNFAKATQFSWEQPVDKDIQAMCKRKIEEKYDVQTSQAEIEETYQKYLREATRPKTNKAYGKIFIDEAEKEIQQAYKTLGLVETASPEDVKKTYYTLARQCHPDNNLDNPEFATEKFQKIASAYKALSNG